MLPTHCRHASETTDDGTTTSTSVTSTFGAWNSTVSSTDGNSGVYTSARPSETSYTDANTTSAEATFTSLSTSAPWSNTTLGDALPTVTLSMIYPSTTVPPVSLPDDPSSKFVSLNSSTTVTGGGNGSTSASTRQDGASSSTAALTTDQGGSTSTTAHTGAANISTSATTQDSVSTLAGAGTTQLGETTSTASGTNVGNTSVSSTTYVMSTSTSVPTYITSSLAASQSFTSWANYTNSSSSPTSTSPTVTLPTMPATNFTQVTPIGAAAKETCYNPPANMEGPPTKVIKLHNDELRASGASMPTPYFESVAFDPNGVDPRFVTVKNGSATWHLDVSNRTHVSLSDLQGNTMTLDETGIHFSASGCKYAVSYNIANFYQQLEALSGQPCAKLFAERALRSRNFAQTVYLKDQCGHGVAKSIRKYPRLKIGDADCVDVDIDATTGKWVFDCMFPAADSNYNMCLSAVDKRIVRFLFRDPFGGACPDVSTVVATLGKTAHDLLNPDALRDQLRKQNLTESQSGEADVAVGKFNELWTALQQALAKNTTLPSILDQYIYRYNEHRDFGRDLCGDLHESDTPLSMSLEAGATRLPALAVMKEAPDGEPPMLNVTVQDPAQLACCRQGSVAGISQETGQCSYPRNATIGDSQCVCGITAAGESIAFEYMECDNFHTKCAADSDCAKAGLASFKCLVKNCCGEGICFDPRACARKDISLIYR